MTCRLDNSDVLIRIVHRDKPAICDAALEVGCGDGRLAARLCRFIKEIVAVDADPNAVALASRSNVQLRNIRFVTCRVEDLDHCLEPRTFDLVISTFTLHHCDDLAAVLRNLKRCVRDGGTLIVVDLYDDTSAGFRKSLIDQIIMSNFRYAKEIWSSAIRLGIISLLQLLVWRLRFLLSAQGFRHMRADFDARRPVSLRTWHASWDGDLACLATCLLLGGIVAFTWRKGTVNSTLARVAR